MTTSLQLVGVGGNTQVGGRVVVIFVGANWKIPDKWEGVRLSLAGVGGNKLTTSGSGRELVDH